MKCSFISEDQLNELEELIARETAWDFWDFIAIEKMFLAMQCQILVSRDIGGVITGVLIYHDIVDAWDLLYIYVLKAFRGKKISFELMKSFQDKASIQTSINHLFLEVSRNNAAAIALYQKTAWKCYGCRKKYYKDGSDALLYKWEPF